MSLTLNRAQLIGGLLGCTMLGSIAGNVATSFADGNLRTDSVLDTNSDYVLPYDGYITLNSTPLNGQYQLKLDLYQSPAPSASPIFSESQIVDIYAGRFNVAIGTASAGLKNVILDAEKLYLGITITQLDANGDPDPSTTIELSGKQAIEAAPYAAWTKNATNMNITNDLYVDQTLHAKALNTEVIRPRYAPFGTIGTGDGGAAIYNDNTSPHQALLITGNTSDGGGDREIKLYDNVFIARDAHIDRNARVDGNLDVAQSLDVTGSINANGNMDVVGRLDASNGDFTNDLSVGQTLTTLALDVDAFRPQYRQYNTSGLGDGGAAIYNDNTHPHRALVITGNTSAGGNRQIRLYDKVTVAGDLDVSGKISGFEITNEISVSVSASAGTDNDNEQGLGVTKTQGFCFLVGHGHNEYANSNNQDSSCYLDIDGGTLEWTLKAGARGGDTTCEARCVRF